MGTTREPRSAEFGLATPNMFVPDTVRAFLPQVFSAMKGLPASVRLHPEFDPWSLVLAAATATTSEVHLRGTIEPESLQVQAWIQSCTGRAISLVTKRVLPEYRRPEYSWYQRLARLSASPENIRRVPEILAEVGVCLVVNHSFPVSRVDGAAFLLPDHTPVIALSLRYSREDSFWFTLFHELAHVANDLGTDQDPIVDDLDVPSISDREIMADDFALQAFVPNSVWRSIGLRFGRANDGTVLNRAANELSISPAVLAGRIRRELGDYTLFTDIVNRTDVRSLLP